jgi:MoxR-like ATPase
VLSDFTVSVPEIGTFEAKQIPLVFLTSNEAREMTDALKRRCLHLWIDYPTEEMELQILNTKVPGIAQRLAQEIVELVHRIRELDLKKSPSISETLDWARALMTLNADSLEGELVAETMNIILKYQGDIHKAQSELNKLLAQKSAEAQPDRPAAPQRPTPPAKKSVLH